MILYSSCLAAEAAASPSGHSLYAFFEENFFKKTFRKPLDNQAVLIYNVQAVTETRQRSRTLKIEQN